MATFDDPPESTEAVTEVDADGAGGAAGAFTVRAFGDRYQRRGLLGVGGMGEVRAWQDRTTGREIAMKTIRGDREAEVTAHRFAREARIQAQLEHPSIVPVYDLGVDDDGALFFTMRRVRGHSLSRVLATLWDRGEGAAGYSHRKLLTVIARVAMTLEYAHRRGVVNRDLKPANVMLGAFDEVYVIDWGLAMVRAGDAPPASRPELVLGLPLSMHGPLVDSSQRPETGSGQLIGTPGYVAPEQIYSADLVDGRADVYALGVILFEILAGERLHRGTTLADVVMSTLETDGASPAARAPDRAIAPELDALCRWATRLDPGDRPARAADVAAAIERYLDGDRDLERRRALAAAQAEAASGALDASRAPGADENPLRARALREVGRALALDPDNLSARRTLLALLTEPARTTPPEAEAAYRATRDAAVRLGTRNGMVGYATYLLYVPLVLWMGLRHAWMFAAMATAIFGALALTYRYYRRPPDGDDVPWPHLVTTTIALLLGSTMFGPLVLLPTIVIAGGVGYIAIAGRSSRAYIGPALTVILGPLALQWAGVLPRSYQLTDGTLRVLPNMTYFPPAATMAFLVVTHVVIVAASLGYVWWLRRKHLDVEHRLHVQAWQLAQLVPAEVRPALAASAAG